VFTVLCFLKPLNCAEILRNLEFLLEIFLNLLFFVGAGVCAELIFLTSKYFCKYENSIAYLKHFFITYFQTGQIKYFTAAKSSISKDFKPKCPFQRFLSFLLWICKQNFRKFVSKCYFCVELLTVDWTKANRKKF
jgi:hypothetical protein